MIMKRARHIRIVSVLAAVGLASLLLGAGVAGAAPPRAALAGFSCQRAMDPTGRSVAVQAVMRPLSRTLRLALRFQLLQRTDGAVTPTIVHGGDLGSWLTPDTPTLGRRPGDVWRLNKSVIDLYAPASYRFRVTFRWTGAGGRVLGSTVRTTRWCRQPELRPDLAVTSLVAAPIAGRPAANRYTAVIANDGRTASGPFQVLFLPGDGSAGIVRSQVSLRAGRSRTATFTGPVCSAAAPPTVTVDSAHQVDDYDRGNNELAATCPAP